jgi:hypothetical protein
VRLCSIIVFSLSALSFMSGVSQPSSIVFDREAARHATCNIAGLPTASWLRRDISSHRCMSLT